MSEFYKYIQSRKISTHSKYLLKGTWWVYITMLIILLIRPFMSFRYHARRFNLQPLRTIQLYIDGYLHTQPLELINNFLGNIMIFIPFGFLLPLCFGRGKSFIRMGLYTFAVSLFIEVWQVYFRVGIFDVDDIMLNVIGGVVGYGLYKLKGVVSKE